MQMNYHDRKWISGCLDVGGKEGWGKSLKGHEKT